jgi:hypothetical protein
MLTSTGVTPASVPVAWRDPSAVDGALSVDGGARRRTEVSTDIDKETIKLVLTVTFQTDDGSPIVRLNCDLERDLVRNIERCVEQGMLTIGHDELIVDTYKIEAETVADE